MADESRTQYSGVIIPDPLLYAREQIWEAQSDYTQSGNMAGIPEPLQTTSLVLNATGEQSANSVIELITVDAGGPETAGIAWRNAGDTNYRGRDYPTMITGWEVLQYATSLTSPTHAINPTILSLQSGKLMVVYEARGLTTPPATRLQARIQGLDGVWGSAIDIDNFPIGISRERFPALIQMPNGDIYCYYWYVEDTERYMNIALSISSDDGLTWSKASNGVLTNAIPADPAPSSANSDFTGKKIAAAQINGQVLFVLHIIDNYAGSADFAKDELRQYASSDYGINFNLIFASGSSVFGVPAVCAANNLFKVAYLAGEDLSSTDLKLYYAEIGSAYYSIQNVSEEVDASYEFGDIFVGTPDYISDINYPPFIIADDQGYTYLYATVFTAGTTNKLYSLCYTKKGGEDWSDVGISSNFLRSQGSWWWTNEATALISDQNPWPKLCSAAWHKGQAVIACNFSANPGTADNSCCIFYLGGNSTATFPLVNFSKTPENSFCWDTSWVAMELPSDMDISGTPYWTATGTGTSSLTTPGTMTITTGIGALDKYYQMDSDINLDAGCIAYFRTQIDSASSIEVVEFTICLDDGSQRYEVAIKLSTTQVRLYDAASPTNIATATVSTTAGIEVIVGLVGDSGGTNTGRAIAWYRVPTQWQDREWTLLGSSSTMNVGASIGSTGFVRFGHDGDLGQSAVSKWSNVHFTGGISTGYPSTGLFLEEEGFFDNIANPERLLVPGIGSDPIYLLDGVSIYTDSGTTSINDEWTITTRHRYPIDNIFEASPRLSWRSSDETEHTIAFRPGDVAEASYVDENLFIDNDVYAFGLFGINFREAYIEGYDDSTGWETLIEIDASSGLNTLFWDRKGQTIRGNNGNEVVAYLQRGEFSNATFSDDQDAAFLWKVDHNSDGVWQGTGRPATLHLKSLLNTDPASGEEGRLWAKNLVAVVYLNGRRYSGFRLKIAAQSTVDGYFTIGSMLFGPVVVFGQRPSFGRIQETQANIEQDVSRDKTILSRVLAPPSRTVQFSWTEGSDLTNIESGTPDYVMMTEEVGAEAIASYRDQAYMMDSLVQYLNGAHTPLVYLPRIPFDTEGADGVILNRRNQSILGRLTTPARIETILGDELSSEVVRVATVTIDEVV